MPKRKKDEEPDLRPTGPISYRSKVVNDFISAAEGVVNKIDDALEFMRDYMDKTVIKPGSDIPPRESYSPPPTKKPAGDKEQYTPPPEYSEGEPQDLEESDTDAKKILEKNLREIL